MKRGESAFEDLIPPLDSGLYFNNVLVKENYAFENESEHKGERGRREGEYLGVAFATWLKTTDRPRRTLSMYAAENVKFSLRMRSFIAKVKMLFECNQLGEIECVKRYIRQEQR